MSLESFYGGKQGISPVIKGSFEYIDINDNAYQAALEALGDNPSTEDIAILKTKTMDLCFADTSYKDVWYDELCIIDTTNKNNPNNGKLFRRTLKHAGDTGTNRCAEYIGRIVGPAGTNPFFSFGNLAFVNAQGTTDKISLNPTMQISYPVDTEGGISSNKINSQGIQFNIEPTIQTASLGNNMLIPGKDGDEYNDDIKYTWLNVLDDRSSIPTRSIVYMGFQIPYPVLEINSEQIDWWNTANIIENENEEHPFYHNWTISIPRGIRGNAVTNIRLAQQNEFSNIPGGSEEGKILYVFDDLVNDGTGIYSIRELTPEHNYYGPNPEELPSGEGVENSYIWVYDYIFYDIDAYDDEDTNESTELSKTYTFYLGKYNEISDIELGNDGTLTFKYSNQTTKIFEKKIKWINTVSVTNDGELIFNSNQGTVFRKQLPFPTGAKIYSDGKIGVSLRTDQNESGIQELFLKNVDSNSQSTADDDFVLNYVTALSMNNNTKVLSYTEKVNNVIKNLNGGKGINYIEAMTIDEKYHLLVYYASNQYRPPSSSAYGTIVWNGLTFRNNFPYSNDKINITASEYWQDLGSVLEKSAGVKVYTEVDYSTHPQQQSIASGEWTNREFINGVLNPEYWVDDLENPTESIENLYFEGNIPAPDEYSNYRGTFVFSADIEGGSLFFYDYDYKWVDENRQPIIDQSTGQQKIGSWIHAGSMSTAAQVDAKIKLNTGNFLNTAQELTQYGMILLQKNTTTSSSLLPNFWGD